MSSLESGLKLADFLDHIAEASRLARDYVAGMSKESFLKDRRTQQAVVLNLMVIGEAAARASSLSTRSLLPLILKSRGLRCAACATGWRTAISP
jgi:uncharacterized protein with HEPN domain